MDELISRKKVMQLARDVTLEGGIKHRCIDATAVDAIKPEPSIPISWIKQHIEWLNGLDNSFSKFTAIQISTLVKTWEGEQDE